jgi:hypothetical protein
VPVTCGVEPATALETPVTVHAEPLGMPTPRASVTSDGTPGPSTLKSVNCTAPRTGTLNMYDAEPPAGRVAVQDSATVASPSGANGSTGAVVEMLSHALEARTSARTIRTRRAFEYVTMLDAFAMSTFPVTC